MYRGILSRLLICVFFFSLCLYFYIDKQNALTKLRLRLPVVAKEVKGLKEENMRLRYEVDLFENPQHLMELANLKEFSHLKHPILKEILTIEEAPLLIASLPEQEKEGRPLLKPRLPLAIGKTH